MITPDTQLIAPPSALQEHITAFMLRRVDPDLPDNVPVFGEYTKFDVCRVIIPAYWDRCLDAGVDPVVTWAQVCHEADYLRSFWSQRPRRNPAGIGVTGRRQETRPANITHWAFNTQRAMWEYGILFDSWTNHAIPAHVGRLLLYALPVGAGTAYQQALMERARAVRSFPDLFRGTAPTLRPLGRAHNPQGHNGAGWAKPGDRYGAKIAAIANAIKAVRL